MLLAFDAACAAAHSGQRAQRGGETSSGGRNAQKRARNGQSGSSQHAEGPSGGGQCAQRGGETRGREAVAAHPDGVEQPGRELPPDQLPECLHPALRVMLKVISPLAVAAAQVRLAVERQRAHHRRELGS
eukprot:COSAG04_NODE_195_length_20819_cov_5.821718_15_plen_130_part_00